MTFGGDRNDITFVSNSSGAHISALSLLRPSSEKLIKRWMALCGVFDIDEYYEWERRRGVHEISALKPVNAHREKGFMKSSPSLIASCLAKEELRKTGLPP